MSVGLPVTLSCCARPNCATPGLLPSWVRGLRAQVAAVVMVPRGIGMVWVAGCWIVGKRRVLIFAISKSNPRICILVPVLEYSLCSPLCQVRGA